MSVSRIDPKAKKSKKPKKTKTSRPAVAALDRAPSGAASLEKVERALRVSPGKAARVDERDPDETHGWPEDVARKMHAAIIDRIDDLQERLHAESKQSLLVVFQAMDAGGKDGAIRNLARGLNPAGVRVAAFKVPSAEEASHDFLWRIHREAPSRGEIVFFNRSHYEDVLVARVHSLVPKSIWRGRYEQIREFEELLGESGVRIVKFFLHISRQEQLSRFRDRLETPSKHWKFSPKDVEEGKHWRAYHQAFEDALTKTSRGVAPWYVVPADQKWFRDLAVASIVHQTLIEMDPRYPEPAYDPSSFRLT